MILMILMILTFVENIRVADMEDPPAVSRVTVGQHCPVANTVQVSRTLADKRYSVSGITSHQSMTGSMSSVSQSVILIMKISHYYGHNLSRKFKELLKV